MQYLLSTFCWLYFKQCIDGCIFDSCFLDGCFSDGYFLDGGFFDGCFLNFSLCKTSLGEARCLGNFYFLLTGCLSIQCFDSPRHSQLGHLWLPTPHCAALVWHANAMPSSGHQALPTQPLPREAEDSPRDERHFKHVLPSTHIPNLPLTKRGIFFVGSIYMPRTSSK